MKEIQVKIEGFTYDTTPENRPAICVFGEENVGKSRFGCTAPHDDGLVGWLALDKNSKAAVDYFKKHHDANYIMVNSEPFLTNADAIKIAMNDDPQKAKSWYKTIVNKVFDQAMKLANHGTIESIVVDDGSQFFDWILFSHFGRRNQIESFQRGAPNNDFIEFINALGSKNLVMICRGTEIWADSGEIDTNTGRKKQAPTGKLKPEGFGKLGKFMTATLELSAGRKKFLDNGSDPEAVREALKAKYRCKVVTCKGDTLLEGQDLAPFGISGEDITWDNVMTVLQTGE
jgi:hypothetical protein